MPVAVLSRAKMNSKWLSAQSTKCGREQMVSRMSLTMLGMAVFLMALYLIVRG
jgi:hypothetical protein